VSVSAPQSGTDVSPRRGEIAFLLHALRSQTRIGAIAPTSPSVARRMARLIPTGPDRIVVELGAGTGAISAAIGPRLGPGSRHIAVEREPELLQALRRKAPWAEQVLGDAQDLSNRLTDLGVPQADIVLSSLPWANFDTDLQQRILDQVIESLAPNGLFAAIAYRPTRMTHGSRAFRSALRASFEHLSISSTLWTNLPPARLYVCHAPTSQRIKP